MKISFIIKKIVFILPMLVLGAGCFSYPRWVNHLPDDQSELFKVNKESSQNGVSRKSSDVPDFTGLWKRHVETHFGIKNRVAVSDGKEEISVFTSDSVSASPLGSAELKYEKLHIYYELVSGKHQEIFYKETGTIRTVLPYLEFTPLEAWYYKSEKKRLFPERTVIQRSDLTHTPVEQISFKKISAPRSLLYYYDSNRRMIIPMVYDRMNRYYDFGIYEGTTGKYDYSSVFFKAAVRRYTEQRIHEHGYIRGL
jgi:hypothetical protein